MLGMPGMAYKRERRYADDLNREPLYAPRSQQADCLQIVGSSRERWSRAKRGEKKSWKTLPDGLHSEISLRNLRLLGDKKKRSPALSNLLRHDWGHSTDKC